MGRKSNISLSDLQEAYASLSNYSAVGRLFGLTPEAVRKRLTGPKPRPVRTEEELRAYNRGWMCQFRHARKGESMKDKTIKIGPRLSEEAATFYEKTFGSKGAGAEFTLEAFPAMYRRTLIGLKGKLTASEISLLIDTLNGTILTPQFLGLSLELCADDTMNLNDADKKWNVDATAFRAKLKTLTLLEKGCLEIFARAFWESGTWAEDDALEIYVAQFAKEKPCL